jgi:hypothetical protein
MPREVHFVADRIGIRLAQIREYVPKNFQRAL